MRTNYFKAQALGAFLITAGLITAGTALADDHPQPGLYKVLTEVSSEQLPINRTHESTQCIKEDQFRSDPNTWMEQQKGQECEFVKYELSGGTINMEMQCNIQGGGAGTMTGTGTYTSNSYQMENNMRMNASGMTMEIKTKVTGTLQGSC